MWVFGYGSLVWKVDFPYVQKVIGYITGYERKFFQASIDHRGIPEKPGRVVTLVKSSNPEDKVWGVAYEISDSEMESIAALDSREKRFEKAEVLFYPGKVCDSETVPTSNEPTVPFLLVTFIGDPNGPLFLGDASVEDIALQIADAKGPSGSNFEYVFKLAEFMKENAKVWGAAYKIDEKTVDEVVEQLDLREVMGYEKVPIEFFPIVNHPLNAPFSFVNEPPLSTPEIANGEVSHINEDDTTISNNISNAPANGVLIPDIIEVPHSNQRKKKEVGTSFTVVMYYGSEENEHFIGPATMESMAYQIYECSGPSGTNKDYLYGLADAMRNISEDALDDHLRDLENAVRDLDNVYNRRAPGTPIEL